MIRGFVTGVLWGALVAGVGLVVVSQLAPPPKAPVVIVEGEAEAEPAPVVEAEPEVIAAEEPEPAAEAEPEPTAETVREPEPTPAPEPVAEAEPAQPEPTPAPETVAEAEPGEAEPAPAPAPVAEAEPAEAEPAPEPDPVAEAAPADTEPDVVAAAESVPEPTPTELTPEPPPADTARPATPLLDPPEVSQAPLTEAAPVTPGMEIALAPEPAAPQPALPAPEPAPAAVPEPNPVPDPGDALLEPRPAAEPAAPPLAPTTGDSAATGPQPAQPSAPGPETTPTTEDAPAPAEPVLDEPAPAEPAAPISEAPRLLVDDQPDTLAPAGTIGNRAEGVTTGRLPSIGGSAEVAAVEPAAEDLPPLQRHARPFAGSEGKPLFVILLRDIGTEGMARDTLTTLPFPVTFVVDPTAPDAGEAEAAYRAAGQEVLMLATGIPAGAQPSDLEQTFQFHAATLPQAVGVVDLPEGGFQNSRDLSAQVVPILQEQGRGLVTYDQGLNAADQVARREGVAAATIFRRLDAEGEDTPVVRRYLDRAAFRAAQEGRVVVIGDTRPETVAAILEWTVEGRAASVTLAPVTAVLSVE